MEEKLQKLLAKQDLEFLGYLKESFTKASDDNGGSLTTEDIRVLFDLAIQLTGMS